MRNSRLKGRVSRRKGVAPVLATLLMIAVAVAMSVIIFMWSQGFLSNTSSATGGQQGAQNQAAQSSVAIEDVALDAATEQFTVIVRNVGAVGVELGSMTVTPGSGNPSTTGNFKKPLIVASLSTSGGTPITGAVAGISAITVSSQTVVKGGVTTIAVTLSGAGNFALTPGDVVTIKITTAVGTFAQGSFTTP